MSGQIFAGAVIGAVVGALKGFNDADGGVKDRIFHTCLGIFFGGMIGAVVGMVGAAIFR